MKRAVLLRLSVALLGLAAAACSSDIDSYCSDKVDCERGSDRDVDNCVSDLEHEADSADRMHCADRFDDLMACRNDTGVCRGGDWETDCGRENERYKSCMKL